MQNRKHNAAMMLIVAMIAITAASTQLKANAGTCGGASITLPFTDVPTSNIFFCSIAEAYFSALTNGTTDTTYNPSDPVPREQMAAFVTRTMDQSLKRGSRRAALGQRWTPTSADDLALTTVGSLPQFVESDGADLWVANNGNDFVSRVRASDGKLLETWTGAMNACGILVAKGRIFVTGLAQDGRLYQIDPSQPPGPVTTLTSSLGAYPQGIAFDGARVWTANLGLGSPGSVSIVTLNPLSVNTVTMGFISPTGILFDGANLWVTDGWLTGDNTLKKLGPNGNILQTVAVDSFPVFPVFDGTNIWVPNLGSNSVTVVRAATGMVLATLTGNGLNNPWSAAFDGERVLVTNRDGPSVSLWKASDLTPLGSVSVGGAGTNPIGACSDGLNFWITLNGTGKLARF